MPNGQQLYDHRLELTVFPAGRGEGLETELNQHPKMYSSIHADVMKESERKRKGSCSVVSDSLRPHGLQPIRLLCPWDFPGKSAGVDCHYETFPKYLSDGVQKPSWLRMVNTLRCWEERELRKAMDALSCTPPKIITQICTSLPFGCLSFILCNKLVNE